MLEVLLDGQMGTVFVQGRELRFALREVEGGDRILFSCMPLLIERPAGGDHYFLTLDGLLAASDQRPRAILETTLQLLSERYEKPGGRRQRALLWSDVRAKGGFRPGDFRVAYLVFWIGRLGSGGGTPTGKCGDETSEEFEYEFAMDERELENMVENATADAWAALQRERRLGRPPDEPPDEQPADEERTSMSYFHVMVTPPGGKPAIMIDLSEERLLREIVFPFRNGRRFTVDGRFVDPSANPDIKIARTERVADYYRAQFEQKERRSGVFVPIDQRRIALDEGEDVTFRLLFDGEESGARADKTNPAAAIVRVFEAFFETTKPLRQRRANKPSIDFKDEYDVQDLLRSHLLVLTPRVEAEEWTPSYAGKQKRMDFLLREFRSAVEAKFVRDATHAGQISEELIIDFDHYQGHPDVDALFCLVYDPGLLIKQPAALIQDLSKVRKIGDKTLEVHVVVSPPHRGS